MTPALENPTAWSLDMAGLHRLIEVLIEGGYRVVGPTCGTTQSCCPTSSRQMICRAAGVSM